MRFDGARIALALLTAVGATPGSPASVVMVPLCNGGSMPLRIPMHRPGESDRSCPVACHFVCSAHRRRDGLAI